MRPEDVAIPEDALSESFLAATGPGGQNVNKVATAVQLRVDVFRLGLHPDVYQRLKTIAGSRMTGGRRAADHRPALPHPGRQPHRCPPATGGNDRGRPYRPAQAQGDAAEPGRESRARRQEEAAQRGQADARKGDVRLTYDFRIEAADSATMYRDLASALGGLVAGEPDAHRQHGQCRRADLGDLARSQLGRLLPQCRRRAGARVRSRAARRASASRSARASAARPRRRARCSASTTSTPSPATSPATARRTASWSCRSFATAS